MKEIQWIYEIAVTGKTAEHVLEVSRGYLSLLEGSAG